MLYTARRHPTVYIDKAHTCHLQIIRNQSILLYEGKILLSCLPNDISPPVKLCQLDIIDISRHSFCDDPSGQSRIILHLCVRLSDSLGRIYATHADLPLSYGNEDLSNYQFGAFVRLIHAQAISDKIHQVCVQIILNQTQLPCVCSEKKKLPIYPKLFCSGNGEFC